jgi:hypothetical protein
MNSKYKSDLKAWLRKYPLPAQQRKNPFEKFVRDQSAFEVLKDEVKTLLTEYNVSMYTKDNQQGNLTVSHYMTLLQKLTVVLNLDLMRECFNLRENYDFILDPQSKKKKTAQKEYKQFLTREVGNGRIQATQYLINNAFRIVNKDIPDIFDHINKVAGYNPIAYEAITVSGKSHQEFKITDKDLLKQQQIKQIRATNKAASSGYSKKDVASKVWRYSYLHPALESEYFERNTGENKDLTKNRQVEIIAPYARSKYAELPPTTFVTPNFQSAYLTKKK